MHLLSAPTNSEWIYFFSILLGLGSFVVAAELIRKALRWSPEVTRKLVHIATGVLIYFAPEVFSSGIPAILLAAVFIVVNYAAIRFGLLKGMHGTNRRSYGTVFYPLSFLILVLLFWESMPQIISISILVLALSDAAAAIVGENLKATHTFFLTSDKKSVEGSLAMFVITFAVIELFLATSSHLNFNLILNLNLNPTLSLILISLAVSLFATVWEAISSKGLDNLAIPLSVAFVLHYFLVPMAHHDAGQFLLGIVFASAVAIVSYRFRLLTLSGSAATFLLATIVFGVGGWQWGIPILTFFLLSSFLSKYGKARKSQFQLMFDKSDRRDAGQVAANGGVAGSVVLCWYFFPGKHIWFPMYLATLAAVTADTWGTEIGLFSRGLPRSITTLKQAEKGTSGAISLAGIIGGAVGGVFIALSGMIWPSGLRSVADAAVIVLAGVLASLVDSLVGATLQAQYRCMKCGKRTERVLHCGEQTTLISGLVWLNNDVVNWCCAASGAVVYLLYSIV